MTARWAIGIAVAAVVVVGLALWWLTRPVAPPARIALQAVSFAALPGWPNGRQAAALPGLLDNCARFARWPDERSLGADGTGGTAAAWRSACVAAATVRGGDDAAARRFFEEYFQAHAVTGPDGREGLFTGYFEPLLHGSRDAVGRFRAPLYRRPADLVTVDLSDFSADLAGRRIVGRVTGGRLVPYPSRAEIDAGALAQQDLELFYVDDPVDAFFLQIQGSGVVRLPDGSVRRVGYAGKNGRPYYAIGRALIDRGHLTRETVSMQSIQAWLQSNPDEAQALMQRNPSYVFFRELDTDGAVGALGVVLIPGRSIAVDRGLIPLGAPMWLDASRPGDGDGAPDQLLRRLVLAQDTGGAIRGAVRGDMFWGAGPKAEHIAGHMRHPGRWYLLLPRTLSTAAAGDD